jgi:hypothetical protein
MKKTFYLLLICIIGHTNLFAQFNIVFNNGEKLEAKKLFAPRKGEMVNYVLQDGTKGDAKKSDIFCVIRKKNIIAFDNNNVPKGGRLIPEAKEMDPKDICSIAVVDAIKQSKIGGAAIGTGVVSFIVWPAGLVTSIVVSSIPPSDKNLNLNESKITDTQYCDCYKKEASKKKKSATWMGWGLGTSIGIPIGMLILLL